MELFNKFINQNICLNSPSLISSSQPFLAVEKNNPLYVSKQLHVDRDLHFSFDDSTAPESVFKLVKKIGNGSFGSVFQVVYTPTMRVFAGKLVNPFILKDENSSDLKVLNKNHAIADIDSSRPYLKTNVHDSHDNSVSNRIYYLSNNQHLKSEIKKSFQKMKNVLSPYTVRYYNCFEYSYEHDCFNFLQSSPNRINSARSIKNSSSFSNFNENKFDVFSLQKPHTNKSRHYNLPKLPSNHSNTNKNRELKRIAEKNRTLLVLMEFCDRGSVRDIMDDRKDVLSEDQISILMKSILTAFDILHNQQHMVHGGLKCSNILLNSNGFVKVAGFGMSENFKSGSSKSFTLLGLPYWMAPESLIDNVFSTETDIWSIGVTAVEMAEGSPPYIELKPSQAVIEICKNGFPGFRYRQGHSKLFRDFVSHCMEMNPKKRWTVSQLLKHPFITSSSKLPRQPTMRPLINKIFEKIEVQNCDTNCDELKEPAFSLKNEPKDIKRLIMNAKKLKAKVKYQPFSVACAPDADLKQIYSDLNEKQMKNKFSKLNWFKIAMILLFMIEIVLLFCGKKELSILCLISQIVFVFG